MSLKILATPEGDVQHKPTEQQEPYSIKPASSAMAVVSSTGSGLKTMLKGVTSLFSGQRPPQDTDGSPQQQRRSERNRGKKPAPQAGQDTQQSRRPRHKSSPASASSDAQVKDGTPVLKSGPRFVLRIAIDYGTFNLNAMYQLKDTQSDIAYPIEAVFFEANDVNSPMWLHVTNNGELLWGHTVRDMYDKPANSLALNEIIRLPKLAMHPGNDQGGLKLVKSQIENLGHGYNNIVKLVQVHLEKVVDHTVEKVKQSSDGMILAKSQHIDISGIQKEIHLGVPQAWDPSSNEVMSQAARNLEFTGQLVVEPQCVAAFHIHFDSLRPAERQLHHLVNGSQGSVRQLVVDAGGGTVDLIKFEMSVSEGARAKMTTIGQPRGELIGSALINNDFVDQILGRTVNYGYKTASELLAALEVDEDNFRLQASLRFETLKTRYPRIEREHAIGFVGTTGTNFLTISRELVKECIDRGIAKVIQLTGELMDKDVSIIVVSGGFGTSHLLKDALKHQYPGVHILEAELPTGQLTLPVAHGALLRHEKVELGALPAGYSYFIVQDNYYDENVHLDAVANPKLRHESVWKKKGSKVEVVLSRVTNLLSTTDVLPDNQSSVHANAFSYWSMLPGDLSITTDIYWSKEDLKERSALDDYRSVEADPIDPQYRLWKKVKVTVSEALLKTRGYTASNENSEGRMAYEIGGRIILKADGAKMEVIFQIAERGKGHAVSSEYHIPDDIS